MHYSTQWRHICGRFCGPKKESWNSRWSQFGPVSNTIFKTCLTVCVSMLGNKSYTDSSCQTLSYVGFFESFLVTTEVRDDRLKVAADFGQFGESSSVLLETFIGRFSENSEIWHADRYSWEGSSAEIARSVAKSRGSYKGSKDATFHTFLHVKTTVFESCQTEAALLHSS